MTRAGVKRSARYFLKAAAKALEVIQAFDQDAARLTLSQVAQRTGMSRASARRYLLTLRDLGFVSSDDGLFHLSPKCLSLGYAYLSSLPLWHVAHPVLEQLVEEVRETCSVTVLDGVDVVVVQRIPLHRMLSFGLTTGSRLPAYCTSMGRVLLGGLSAPQLEEYFAAVRPRRFTPRTETDPDALRRIIERDRTRGYAVVSGEIEDRLTGISVPIREASGRVVAALNVSVLRPYRSERELLKPILPKLRAAAERIAVSIGLHAST